MTATEDLLAIADRATSYDGVAPLSEQTRLALRHTEPRHVIRTDGVVTAGAYVAEDGAVELVVDPDRRRLGSRAVSSRRCAAGLLPPLKSAASRTLKARQ